MNFIDVKYCQWRRQKLSRSIFRRRDKSWIMTVCCHHGEFSSEQSISILTKIWRYAGFQLPSRGRSFHICFLYVEQTEARGGEKFWNERYNTSLTTSPAASRPLTTKYAVMEGIENKWTGIRWLQKAELEICIATIEN